MKVSKKVIAYVVHPNSNLLVFVHDSDKNQVNESGLQVPAGTVETGESIESAVLREVYEESGLDVEIDRYLGVSHYDMRPYSGSIQERHFFQMSVSSMAAVPDKWSHLEDSGGRGPAHLFNFYWLPIRQCHVLAAGQGAMLAQVKVSK